MNLNNLLAAASDTTNATTVIVAFKARCTAGVWYRDRIVDGVVVKTTLITESQARYYDQY